MRSWILGIAASAALASAGPAQVRTIDPNRAIDSDLPSGAHATVSRSTPAQSETLGEPVPVDPPLATTTQDVPPPVVATSPTARAEATMDVADTYPREDLMAAGEGVFGKGAAGLGGILEKILREQGRPNAYIAGREAAGAFIVGLRYGSGVMSHKVEGTQPVYWTGPSIGFDAGGDANKVFVLVYNLHDTEELFHRFPAAEGRLYFIGGFAATYLRRGNIVLIPIRLGVGYRAGVNVGYMKITHKAKWMPF
ncbi:DUF1134 domain-containing protein [Sphingomonas sp. Tas61C01]|uniref:DUF1134 domain-containing protein n=1 Tax=Sphingomonas sp. Tas61C01 TaxID=3458297 RepID=UPI00403E7176